MSGTCAISKRAFLAFVHALPTQAVAGVQIVLHSAAGSHCFQALLWRSLQAKIPADGFNPNGYTEVDLTLENYEHLTHVTARERGASAVGAPPLGTLAKMQGASGGLPSKVCRLEGKLHEIVNICRQKYQRTASTPTATRKWT
jgi:hypothetical protein